MSVKKLLTEDQTNILYSEYHSYIVFCRKKNLNPELNAFYDKLKRRHSQFDQFKNKQISNQIIASRNKYGSILWPNLDNLKNYISPSSQTFIDKSVKAALLAVEIYNKPTVDYRTEGYIVMMNVAWNSLFHALFSNSNQPYKYKTEDKKEKFFELTKCISKYNGTLKKEIEANLTFLIKLRDQIVHRIIPELDDLVFGECQACLYNFEKILTEYFHSNYQINNTLAYSLQFSKKYSDEQLEVRKSYDLKSTNSVVQFIQQYRDNLDPDVFQSINYSFRVFMIPKVGNHIESSDLAVEFIKYDPQNVSEYDSYEKLLYVIRDKRVPGEFFKAGEVAKKVYESLKDKKSDNWKFSASYHHAKCSKYFKVRIGHYNGKFCIYDPTFNQHIYTKEWISFLTEKLNDEELYKKIMSSD